MRHPPRDATTPRPTAPRRDARRPAPAAAPAPRLAAAPPAAAPAARGLPIGRVVKSVLGAAILLAAADRALNGTKIENAGYSKNPTVVAVFAEARATSHAAYDQTAVAQTATAETPTP